jgi:hypothetical protein
MAAGQDMDDLLAAGVQQGRSLLACMADDGKAAVPVQPHHVNFPGWQLVDCVVLLFALQEVCLGP